MNPLTEVQKELYDWLVDYIRMNHHAPSIRQMMHAMQLKSPAPIQSRLEHLKNKGYITWTQGKARTIQITNFKSGIPIKGAIAAGGLVEPFSDEVDAEHLDIMNQVYQDNNCFALRVTGDSMIEDFIAPGDLVILKPVPEVDSVKNGSIVAAMVEGEGTTLKRFYRNGEQVKLKPANRNYRAIEALANKVTVQGVLVGVWRNFNV